MRTMSTRTAARRSEQAALHPLPPNELLASGLDRDVADEPRHRRGLDTPLRKRPRTVDVRHDAWIDAKDKAPRGTKRQVRIRREIRPDAAGPSGAILEQRIHVAIDAARPIRRNRSRRAVRAEQLETSVVQREALQRRGVTTQRIDLGRELARQPLENATIAFAHMTSRRSLRRIDDDARDLATRIWTLADHHRLDQPASKQAVEIAVNRILHRHRRRSPARRV